jgi:hypothetical protein
MSTIPQTGGFWKTLVWAAANAINPDSLFCENARHQLGHRGTVQRVFTQSGAGLGCELHWSAPVFWSRWRVRVSRSHLLGVRPGRSRHRQRLMVQRRARPLGLIVYPPDLNGGARLFERGAPGLRQARLPKAGTECRAAESVGWGPWPSPRQFHAMTMCSGIPCLGRERWPMIDEQRLGQPICAGQPRQHGHHALATQGAIALDRWTLMGHVIHAREGAKPAQLGDAQAGTLALPPGTRRLAAAPRAADLGDGRPSLDLASRRGHLFLGKGRLLHLVPFSPNSQLMNLLTDLGDQNSGTRLPGG